MRPSWEDYFLNITKLISERSSCLRRKVGAIAVMDKRILATGYNGPPTAMKHCKDRGGCVRVNKNIKSGENHEVCYAIHAEENVIIQAAIHGISIKDSTIYLTNKPCSMCMRKLINCRIQKIVYIDEYPDKRSDELIDLYFRKTVAENTTLERL